MRLRGFNHPARLSRARLRKGAEPKHDRCHARAFGGERETAAGGKVESRRAAPAFDQDSAKSGAGERLPGGFQRLLRLTDFDDDKPVRIKAEFGETGTEKLAPFGGREILSDPQEGVFVDGSPRQPPDKAARRHAINLCRGEHLV